MSATLLEVVPDAVVGRLAFSAALGRIASRPKTAAWREGSRRRVINKEGFVVVAVVIALVVGLGAQVVQAWRRVDKRAVGGRVGGGVDVDRREAHSAKPMPSDWARRNRSSLPDGAAGFKAGGIAGAWTRGLEGRGHSGAPSLEVVASSELRSLKSQKVGKLNYGSGNIRTRTGCGHTRVINRIQHCSW